MRMTCPRSLTAILVMTAALGAATVVHASPIVVRYASPGGLSVNPCTQTQPCDIATAINNAPADAEVLLQSGTYGSAKHPLTTDLQTSVSLTIDGGSVDHPASIFSAAPDTALLLNGPVNNLADVVIHSSASTGGLYLAHGVAEHVAVYASSGAYGACSVYGGELIDAICSATGAYEPAIAMNDSGTGTVTSTFEAVTAIATGSNDVGLEMDESHGIDFTVAVTDSVIRGTAHDLEVSANAGGTATITINHSDFRPSSTLKQGTSPTAVVSGQGNITGAPKFLDVATGDLRERQGSPTVDAGAAFSQDPATDLAGHPRLLGKAQDIGAYEFLPKPLLKRTFVVALHAHRMTFGVTVNPERLPTKVGLVAVHNGKKLAAPRVSAGSGAAAKTFHLTLTGLTASTRYTVYAVAVSKGGTSRSPGRVVETKA
jgi:hypothetical protein